MLDVENGERVFPVIDAALRKDDGYEVDARRTKERDGGRFGKELRAVISKDSVVRYGVVGRLGNCLYPHVDVGDVAHDVIGVVKDRERGDGLFRHEFERRGERAVPTVMEGCISLCARSVCERALTAYLMFLTVREPTLRSCRAQEKRGSIAGKWRPNSQKKRTRRSCVSTPTASLVPCLVIMIR